MGGVSEPLRRFTNSVVGLGARTTAVLPMKCWSEKDILLLPLPLLRRGLSRGCAQRFGFRRRVDQGIRDCVECMNWFTGLANWIRTRPRCNITSLRQLALH